MSTLRAATSGRGAAIPARVDSRAFTNRSKGSGLLSYYVDADNRPLDAGPRLRIAFENCIVDDAMRNDH